jgi:hypothetical protein
VLPSRIDDFANNRYYNSVTGVTTIPFSGVRATNGLHFDAQGRLVWGPANVITRSGTATGVAGSPGSAPTGWALSLGLINGVTRSIVEKTDRYMDIRVVGTFTAAENLTIAPAPGVTAIVASAGQSWTGSFWWQVLSGTLPAPSTPGLNGCRIRFGSPGLLAQNGDSDTPRTTYARISNTRVAPASTTVVGCDFTWTFNAGAVVDLIIRIGDFQLEQTGPDSPKAYIETTGTAFFGARLDFAPNAGPARGILLEPARTNDVANGTAITSVAAATNTTGGTYLGNWVFSRFTGNGASAVHSASSSVLTPGASQVRRVSVVARAVSGTRVQVAPSTAHAPADAYVNVNLSTGAVLATGAGASNVTVEGLINSCWRIGFDYTTIGTPASGAGVECFLITSDADLRAPTNTSADVIDLDFFENAAGTGDQSIIPTFSVAATRGADTLSAITTNLGTTLANPFTAYASYASRGQNGSFPAIYCVGDGVASSDEHTLFEGTTVNQTLETKDGGVNVHTASALAAGAARTVYKLATTCGSGANANRILRNGGTPVSKTPSAFPTFNRISYGNFSGRGGGTGPASGMWLQEVRLYPTNSASDAQLQTLTT